MIQFAAFWGKTNRKWYHAGWETCENFIALIKLDNGYLVHVVWQVTRLFWRPYHVSIKVWTDSEQIKMYRLCVLSYNVMKWNKIVTNSWRNFKFCRNVTVAQRKDFAWKVRIVTISTNLNIRCQFTLFLHKFIRLPEDKSIVQRTFKKR